jgi:NhaP-type Na+/H+ or K+/H+ antiporter
MKDESAQHIVATWSVTTASILIAQVSQIVGLIAMVASLAYTIWRWRRDILKDKK